MFVRQLRRVLDYSLRLPRTPRQSGALRRYGKDKSEECQCGCKKKNGKCTCGPECKCPHCQDTKRRGPCRLGASPRSDRDPPPHYRPLCFGHSAFELPLFINPALYRPLKGNEILGPHASKKSAYKNPEYFAYHRFSYYELKAATQKLAECASRKCPCQ